MRNKFPKILILLGLVSLFSLFPIGANAAAPLLVAFGVFAGIPMLLGLIKGVTSISLFLLVAGGVTFVSGRLIDWGVALQNSLFDPQRLAVIQTVWEILRDFINLFFILILVVIAFATIFNVKNYKASDLLPKLIVAALLINFSLVIGSWVLDLLWVPVRVFLNPLTDGDTVSNRISDILVIQKIFSPEFALGALASSLSNNFTTFVFSQFLFKSMMLVAEAFILSWIALILLARIPILIGLLIISPIAWLGFTIPAMKKQTWDNWWQKLFCWGSIPIPLFGLIYFVIYFNQRLKEQLSGAIPASSVPLLGGILAPMGITVSQFLIWIITVGIFIGGMMYIKELSCSLYGWVSKAFFGTWGGIRRGAGWAVDTTYQARGWKGAVGQVQKEFKEGGVPLPIFGRRFGVAQREAREARREDWLRAQAGLGPVFSAQRNLLSQSDKASKDIDNRFKQARSTTEETAIINELRTKVSSGAKDPETLAAINALAKKGQLDAALFNQAVENFKDTPLALTKVMNEWKEGKFGGVKADELMPILKDLRVPLEAKRIGYNFIASDDGKRVIQDNSFNSAAFEEMYEVLGGRNTKDGRNAKKFVGEINPVVVGKYDFNNKITEFDDPADYPTDVADAILKQIKKTGSKDFTKYGKDIWNDLDFKSALGDLLYNKAITDIGNARKYADEVRKWLIRESKDVDELRTFNDAATMAGI